MYELNGFIWKWFYLEFYLVGGVAHLVGSRIVSDVKRYRVRSWVWFVTNLNISELNHPKGAVSKMINNFGEIVSSLLTADYTRRRSEDQLTTIYGTFHFSRSSSSSSRPPPAFVLASPTNVVEILHAISPKLLIVFDAAHLRCRCSSEIFKVATNVFNPTCDRSRLLSN